MFSKSRFFTCLLLAVVAISANGFVANKTPALSQARPTTVVNTPPSTTALSERQWNFNEGRSPWGMKKNAETWNGRVAQMAFVWIVLQELITGKGIFKGIEEGDPFFIANAAAFGLCTLGLTGFLAFKGEEDYTKF